ncbi:hypothetical protein PPERSA_02021 [Pseudocohnilembus persalinus]|uniref:Transmembrane protein n=1 Tax=Pseudocohnilembus persalinus TaxID=266149 RepID=A0A0V0QF63_PSEPJ|nr:hypothetical protein PPERSA_02021 [Pseudocohnilembus persalinus]|eukprot:KRX00842.1 hypothetical protein PPERSA_02021 [Pseudocohnilembus persalinus]
MISNTYLILRAVIIILSNVMEAYYQQINFLAKRFKNFAFIQKILQYYERQQRARLQWIKLIKNIRFLMQLKKGSNLKYLEMEFLLEYYKSDELIQQIKANDFKMINQQLVFEEIQKILTKNTNNKDQIFLDGVDIGFQLKNSKYNQIKYIQQFKNNTKINPNLEFSKSNESLIDQIMKDNFTKLKISKIDTSQSNLKFLSNTDTDQIVQNQNNNLLQVYKNVNLNDQFENKKSMINFQDHDLSKNMKIKRKNQSAKTSYINNQNSKKTGFFQSNIIKNSFKNFDIINEKQQKQQLQRQQNQQQLKSTDFNKDNNQNSKEQQNLFQNPLFSNRKLSLSQGAENITQRENELFIKSDLNSKRNLLHDNEAESEDSSVLQSSKFSLFSEKKKNIEEKVSAQFSGFKNNQNQQLEMSFKRGDLSSQHSSDSNYDFEDMTQEWFNNSCQVQQNNAIINSTKIDKLNKNQEKFNFKVFKNNFYDGNQNDKICNISLINSCQNDSNLINSNNIKNQSLKQNQNQQQKEMLD